MTPAKIRRARLTAGLKQQECADLMGWDEQRWGRKERGETRMERHEWRYFLHVAGLEQIPFSPVRR